MSLKDRIEFSNKVKKWNEIKEKLAVLKNMEMELRVDICTRVLTGKKSVPIVGKCTKTEKIEIGEHYFDLKADGKVTRKIDQSQLKSFVESGQATEQENNAIVVKYDLPIAKLKDVHSDSVLHDFIHEVVAAPTLSLKMHVDKE